MSPLYQSHHSDRRRRLWLLTLIAAVPLVACSLLIGPDPSVVANATATPVSPPVAADDENTQYTVFGYNDLGMHCMNEDFSELCILPPYNNLHAQVIRRGEEPRIVTERVQILYSIRFNRSSIDKTNFWDYVQDLFGVQLPDNIGLTGNGLYGVMEPTGHGDWAATGIPITPLTDFRDKQGNYLSDPYQLSSIVVNNRSGNRLATTVAVVPVSWEISCHLCHTTKGISVATDILRKHDQLHNTQLESQKPVLCASCHADPALGTTGVEGVSTFSHAMHSSHAPRMQALPHLDNSCYACHPGTQSECQRDIHNDLKIKCIDCHGDMNAVADPQRIPWVSEPKCGDCHSYINPRFDYEEQGKLFKDSKGHGGVFCAACHGPQHAVGPAETIADNLQAIYKQGERGTIRKCTVCHTRTPEEPFFHSRED